MPSSLPAAIAAVEQLYVGEHPLLIEGGVAVTRYLKCRLHTRLQPLVGGAQVVGCYGRLSVQLPTGLPIPARTLFSLAGSGIARLDRLCRTMHMVNWLAAGRPGGSLHMPVHPRLAATVREPHGQTFAKVLHALDVEPQQVWLLLKACKVGPRLADALHNYAALGLRTGLALTPQDAATAAHLPDADAWYLDAGGWTEATATALIRAASAARRPLRLRQGNAAELPPALYRQLEAWPDLVSEAPMWGSTETG